MTPVELEVYRHPWSGYGVFVHDMEGEPNIANLGGYASIDEAIEAGHRWSESSFHKVVHVTRPDGRYETP